MTKYLIGIILILGVLGFFSIKSCTKKADEIETLQKDTAKLNLKVNFLQDFANKLQTAATEKTIEYTEKYGNLSKKYNIDVTKYRYLLAKAENKPPDSVFIPSEDIGVKLVSDSLRNEDLFLHWRALVLGELLQIDFNYQIKEKSVVEKKIIYEDRFVDKPFAVWYPKRHLYCTGAIGIKGRAFSFGLLYTTKKRLLLGLSYDMVILDNTYNYWKVKVGYQLF